MSILIIINDGPYGTEKAYNALRLANQILRDDPEKEVVLFLLADAVGCAVESQQTPDGYYNIERMLRAALKKGAQVKLCTTCAQARGIKESMLLEGAAMGTLAELSRLTLESGKVLTF